MKKQTLEEDCSCTDECLGYLTMNCKGIETLEEAAERHRYGLSIHNFIRGAEWQAERSYGKKEVLEILNRFHYDLVNSNLDTKEEWFKQFKKK